jgi:hypothetical protein
MDHRDRAWLGDDEPAANLPLPGSRDAATVPAAATRRELRPLLENAVVMLLANRRAEHPITTPRTHGKRTRARCASIYAHAQWSTRGRAGCFLCPYPVAGIPVTATRPAADRSRACSPCRCSPHVASPPLFVPGISRARHGCLTLLSSPACSCREGEAGRSDPTVDEHVWCMVSVGDGDARGVGSVVW